MTATPQLKRTYSWKIEKSVSQPAVTLAAGATADVTYTSGRDADRLGRQRLRGRGNVNMTRDPVVDVAWLNVNVYLDNGVNDPNGSRPRCRAFRIRSRSTSGSRGWTASTAPHCPTRPTGFAQMRAQRLNPDGTLGNFRGETVDFNFLNPTVNQVDESVTVTDSMGGTLGMP